MQTVKCSNKIHANYFSHYDTQNWLSITLLYDSQREEFTLMQSSHFLPSIYNSSDFIAYSLRVISSHFHLI